MTILVFWLIFIMRNLPVSPLSCNWSEGRKEWTDNPPPTRVWSEEGGLARTAVVTGDTVNPWYRYGFCAGIEMSHRTRTTCTRVTAYFYLAALFFSSHPPFFFPFSITCPPRCQCQFFGAEHLYGGQFSPAIFLPRDSTSNPLEKHTSYESSVADCGRQEIGFFPVSKDQI